MLDAEDDLSREVWSVGPLCGRIWEWSLDELVSLERSLRACQSQLDLKILYNRCDRSLVEKMWLIRRLEISLWRAWELTNVG